MCACTYCSYEELLMESSDEEGDHQEQTEKGRAAKASKDLHQKQQTSASGRRGQAWIKEGGVDEPVNFLDPSVTQRVSGEFHVTYGVMMLCFLASLQQLIQLK